MNVSVIHYECPHKGRDTSSRQSEVWNVRIAEKICSPHFWRVPHRQLCRTRLNSFLADSTYWNIVAFVGERDQSQWLFSSVKWVHKKRDGRDEKTNNEVQRAHTHTLYSSCIPKKRSKNFQNNMAIRSEETEGKLYKCEISIIKKISGHEIIADMVCSSRCHDNRFTEVSVKMVVISRFKWCIHVEKHRIKPS